MTDIRIPEWLQTGEASPLPVVTDGPFYIYGLIDPRTEEIRYIGKSVRPHERTRNHINEPPSNCHRSHWLQQLKRASVEPVLVLLEHYSGGVSWQRVERWWIAFGRSQGWPLTNNTDGGDGVRGLSDETRERMRKTWLGRRHKPETIEKLRIARRRRVTSDATRAKMSATRRGRKITWSAKVAESLRKLTPEQEQNIRERLDAGERVIDLAREFGMHRTSISKVKKGTYRGTRHH